MLKNEKVNIALAQISPKLGDLKSNLDKHLDYIQKAKNEKADLVVFPELSLTGYSLKDAVYDVAMKSDDVFLKPIYEASEDIAVSFGMVELTNNFQAKNTQLFLENGKLTLKHQKVYLPTYGVFEEKRYFSEGDRFQSFDSSLGRFGMLICEDMWHFSSTMILAQDGASVILCSSAGLLRSMQAKGKPDNIQIWENLNSSSAHNYTSYFVFCNRVGMEDGLIFWGGSEIVDPSGKVVAKAPYFEETLITGEINQKSLKHARIHTTLLSDEKLELVIDELQRIIKQNRENN
jgi:predicted amidohydrolase